VERTLRKALRALGLSYRINFRGLPGDPILWFPDSRVASSVMAIFGTGDLEKLRPTQNGDPTLVLDGQNAYNIAETATTNNALRKGGNGRVVRSGERCPQKPYTVARHVFDESFAKGDRRRSKP